MHMSKKIMKRSLVLSVLMAFVITGQVWAAEDNNNNVVINDGGTYTERVRGGYSEDGVANGNVLSVIGSTFSGDSAGIVGGYGDAGASNNEVHITDSTVTSAIWGGSAGGTVGGDANGNKVVLTDTIVNKAPWRYIYGGYSQSGSSSNNEIVINNTVVDTIINGGHIQTGNGDAVGNKVIINSGETMSNIQAGQAQYGQAKGNELVINGGVISNVTSYASIKGGYSAYGDAIENIVSINGGIVYKDVYAGYGQGQVKGNVINIGGTANVENANLFGSQKSTDSTGNTLNVGDSWSGIIGSAANFNTINITDDATVEFGKALSAQNATVNVTDATWKANKQGNKVGTLTGQNGIIEIDDSLLGKTGVVTITTNESTGTVLKTSIQGIDLSDGAKEALQAANTNISEDVKNKLDKAVSVTTNNGDSFGYAVSSDLTGLYGYADLVDGKVVTEMDTDTLVAREDVVAGDVSLKETAEALNDKADKTALEAEVAARENADVGLQEQIDNLGAGSSNAISGLNQRLDKTNAKINKVGAGAAALAALHPLDYDPDDKLTFSAGVGNYAGENAAALGAFYRPNEKFMISLGGTMGNGENMVNLGLSIGLDKASGLAKLSKKELIQKVNAVEAENDALEDRVAKLEALVAQLASK